MNSKAKWKKILLISLIFTMLIPINVSAEQVTSKELIRQRIRVEEDYINGLINSPNKIEYLSALIDNPYLALDNTYLSTLATINKTTANTINSQNTEQFRIPEVIVKGDGSKSSSTGNAKKEYTLFTVNPTTEGKGVSIFPIIAYKDNDNNLVFWTSVDNYTGETISLGGFYEIELIGEDGNVMAGGDSELFSEPMKYSKRPDTKINPGVIDGLPTGSFMKLIFEPGSYDANLDVSNIGRFVISYVPEIQPLS